jgi:hypothetical protein
MQKWPLPYEGKCTRMSQALLTGGEGGGGHTETSHSASLQEVKIVIEDLGILLQVVPPDLNTKLTHKHYKAREICANDRCPKSCGFFNASSYISWHLQRKDIPTFVRRNVTEEMVHERLNKVKLSPVTGHGGL